MSRYKTLNSGWGPEGEDGLPEPFEVAKAALMHDLFVRGSVLPHQILSLVEEIERFSDAPLEGLDEETIMFDINGLLYRLRDIDWDVKAPSSNGDCTLGDIVSDLLFTAVEARSNSFIHKRMFNAVLEDIKSLGIDLN